ncbi:transcription factor bHLH18-like [Cornus florida]|uniref:transcription factor bHLH18-like n=1 Tax=Cornus florida TaxID=4283 RepID=UPI0028963286|nr:transcription factor bHLH18-like [Cornus florida]
MDMSSARWISEMGIDDYNFMNHSHMNSLDDFTAQQLVTTVGENIQHSFSSKSYKNSASSYPIFNPKGNTTTAATTFTDSPQAEMSMMNANTWKYSSTTEEVTPKAASSSSSHITFANSGSPPPYTKPQHLYGNLDFSSIRPKDEMISFPLNSEGSYGSKSYAQKESQGTKRPHTMTRSPSHAQDHIMAERKRREKLSQRFIALSAIVPGLKKMDKASVLGDAVKYLKQLQERVKLLEEQTEKKSEESVVYVKKCHISGDDHDDSSCGENFLDGSNDALPEIEARVSEKNVLIRIHCEQKKGILVKIVSKIEKLHLSVVNTSVLPFGKYAMDITIIAQMEDEFCMTVMDLVRSLRSDFLELV